MKTKLLAMVMALAVASSGCAVATAVWNVIPKKTVEDKCPSPKFAGTRWCEASKSCIANDKACEAPKPASCEPNPCPADKPVCLAEHVHGDRSGPPETWTEGVMVSCHPQPDPDPKPSPEPVLIPDPSIPAHGEGHLVEEGKGDKSAYWQHVNIAIDFALGAGRDPGFPVTDWQAFYKAFREKLADLGYSVNYDWSHGDPDPNPLPNVKPPLDHYDSEFTIWSEGGCHIEFFQLISSAKKLRRATEVGGAYRGFAYRQSCTAAQICVDPVPGPLARFEVKIHNIGPSWVTFDSTPQVGAANGDRDRAYCKAVGFTDGRGYCPPRQEGNPERPYCDEKVVGGTTWYWNNDEVLPGNPVAMRNDNRFQLLVRPGNKGVAKICSEFGACGQIEIK